MPTLRFLRSGGSLPVSSTGIRREGPRRITKIVRVSIAVFVLLVLCLQPGLGARRLSENAALKYLRADAALRQSYPLSPDTAAKLESVLESSLNVDDEKLAAAATEALVEFDHGATLKRCDWAMSSEDGPYANTSHRGAMRELVAVSGIRARLRFRDQDVQGAMDDVLAAMAAARHLSLDGTLASVLFA
jgi:hypothetical protein